jgi:hypothetical protein
MLEQQMQGFPQQQMQGFPQQQMQGFPQQQVQGSPQQVQEFRRLWVPGPRKPQVECYFRFDFQPWF